MAEVVFSGVASDTHVQGTLFQGIKFWISHKVPQRSGFLNDVKANGGEVLPLEKSADVKIVDHARKEAPPGSHSYTFIEKSMRNGLLEDLDDHKVGPPEGNIRSIGSVVQPAKGTRNKYTNEDDRVLWNWVNDNPQKGGGTDGNEIYKQLETKHPQHPWQSWRDRWIRHLKGKTAPFALPHNAPPTPPFDGPPITESSRNRASTSDPAEDEYQLFSDDDAEALMINGDDILNIHPDNIAEAWESWTRDHDRDSIHTAQQWHSYWEERVRPRYLKRKAKQTRRASPENAISARNQIPISPKRNVAPPVSAFSPSKEDHALMPELAQKTISKPQNPASPKRSTATLPSTPSPAPKPGDPLITEPLENPSSLGVQSPVLPKSSVVIHQSGSSPSVEKDYLLKPAARSPSYHPKSPTMTATAPSINQQETNFLSKHMHSLPSNNEQQIQKTPEKTRSPNHETLKRKHPAIEEDLPSSSPLGPISPKRRRPIASELPLEIASTPQKSQAPYIEGRYSPLFIDLDLEEDEPSLPEDATGNDSPLGQQLSEILSDSGRLINNTQAVSEDATPPIDFDIPAPEWGWDNEGFLFQNSSQPVGFDVPPPGNGGEDRHGIKESIQLGDFDLLPEGRRDEVEPQVKSESESPNTGVYDPQPTLPDTQATTQLGDFDPLPEGRWDEVELQVKSESESPNTGVYDPQPTLPDTQAILRSKTPAPDFSIPDPDGGWDSLMVSSPPIMPDSPRAESVFSQTDLKDQMDAWIDAHAIKGISVEQVESVLMSTSMDTILADKVLRHLAKKGMLPKDWRGVWTDSDDEELKSTDARNIQRLEKKHGADCLTARWEFLDFYAEEA